MQSEPQDFWYVPNSSKVTSIDNDLKQKILMIQRIAEEAKLTDLDIKKEENVSNKIPQYSKKGKCIFNIFCIMFSLIYLFPSPKSSF